MEHGREELDLGQGYSACSRAEPPPEKNDCSVCAARWTTRSPSTRPTHPRSSGCPTGWNMQSFTARCAPRRRRSPGRRSAHVPRSPSPGRAHRRRSLRFEPEREEGDDAVVGAHEAELARVGTRLLAYRGLDGRGVDGDLLSGRRLFQRLDMRLDGPHLGHLSEDRGLDALRDVVCLVEREGARELQVQRDLDAPVDVEHREVVDLAHVRDRERRREARVRGSHRRPTRLDVDDDVDPRKSVVQGLLDAVGGGVPLADGGAGATPMTTSAKCSRPRGGGGADVAPRADRAARSHGARPWRPPPATDP